MISLVVLALLASNDPTSEAALVQQAKEAAAPVARQTHVSQPLKGDTLSAMGNALDEIDGLWTPEFHARHRTVIDRVLHAEGLYDKLPDELQTQIEKSLPVVKRVLDSSHAETVRLPRELTAFARAQGGPHATSIQRAMIVATLAGWNGVELRENGPLYICIDALGVMRDLSYGNLLGRSQANHGVHALLPMCLAALTQQEIAKDDCDAIGVVEQGFAPFSRTLQQEKLFIELSSFASGISDETKEQLPEEAKAILGQNAPTSRMERWRHSLFGGMARKRFVSTMDQLVAAADLPVDEADADLEKVDLKGGMPLWLYGRQPPPPWLDYLRQTRHATTELRALRMACELRVGRASGEWPKIDPLLDARNGQPMRVAIANSHEAIVFADPDPAHDAKQIALDLTLREGEKTDSPLITPK